MKGGSGTTTNSTHERRMSKYPMVRMARLLARTLSAEVCRRGAERMAGRPLADRGVMPWRESSREGRWAWGRTCMRR